MEEREKERARAEVRWESEKGDGAVIGCSYLKA